MLVLGLGLDQLLIWKAVADVLRNLQRVLIITQRVVDVNQPFHFFYNAL